MPLKFGEYYYEFVAGRPEGHQWRVGNHNDDPITDFPSEAAAKKFVNDHNDALTGKDDDEDSESPPIRSSL